MWLGIVMVALGVGSSAAALIHYRDSRQGKPVYYPLLYDLMGAAGFLAFGAGTLLHIGFFTGRGRLWLLLLIPIAIEKWRRTLAGRQHSGGSQRQRSAAGKGTWK